MSTEITPGAPLSPLKQAFLAIEDLQARLDASERARHEPIAIVGMGMRFPGGVTTPEEYWSLLVEGVDAIAEIPPERWEIDAWYNPDPDAPGKMSQRHMGYLRDVDRFDPQFFGIAPREAAAMDPQQRLLLEVSWEALERAGIAPARLAGSRTGVFVGVTSGDYRVVSIGARGLEGLDAYFASGNAQSIASGRLSYVYGLEGPSLTIDTACSSSLVAVHLAVQSLRSGECPVALAGAVNLILAPENSITLSKYQMLAPDGRCKFGDASADGFVRGEGCAMLVLKRLSDAQADGDPILAVIRGSALNQDGASSGLTAPNGPSQEAVLRAALADAGATPAEVSYIEAHGTGTALGDPIEVQALGAVFADSRPGERPLLVGSVKSNFGHLEGAAGMAGLIKLVLMLQHGQVPPSLHFATPSPHIDWEELPLRVPTALEPWPQGGARLGGVSSFGFSGTNAHLLLQAAPPPVETVNNPERPLHLLALSAQNEPALRALATSYAAVLDAENAPALQDVAFTANSGRRPHAHRLALSAATSTEAAALLAAWQRGETPAALLAKHSERADPPRVAFLFTGQGSQYAGMGRDLYAQHPLFRATLDRCATILAPHLDRPLLELLFAEPGTPAAAALDDTTYTQPALVALQVALATLWRSWGVEPAAMLGHSVGEYAAAIIAGVFSLEEGLALVATRGRLMGKLPAGGAMAAIFAPAGAVEAALAEQGGSLVVAAYNGPEHLTVAGPEAEVLAIVERFSARGTRAQRLAVSHAFHSPLLDPMLDAFEAAVRATTRSAPRLRLLSNLSGGAAGAELTTPDYWRRHARQPVRFAQAVEQAAQLGCELFIEIGPHPTLIGMAKEILPPNVGVWLPSLRKNRDGWPVLLASLAGAYIHGAAIDWAGFDAPYARRKLQLPTYPFQRERYWVQARLVAAAPRASLPAGGEHPLLGRRLRSALKVAQFEQQLAPGMLGFLDDHRVFGATILPAAAFAEVALAAARAALASPQPALEDLLIHQPFVIGAGELRTLQTLATPTAGGASIEIFSQGEGEEEWTLHVSAAAVPSSAATPGTDTPAQDAPSLDDVRAACREELSVAEHYAALHARGMELGASLQAVRRLWRGEGQALGELALDPSQHDEAAQTLLHPALLDACLQLIAAARTPAGAGPGAAGDTYLPIAIDSLRTFGPVGTQATAVARLLPQSTSGEPGATLTGVIYLFDAQGRLAAQLDGLRLKRAEARDLRRPGRDAVHDWLYGVEWRALPAEDAPGEETVALPPPAAVGAAVHARIPALDAELELPHYHALTPALEQLATDFIINALYELGWQPQAGAQVESATLAAQLGVVPGLVALFDRFLATLAHDGYLRAVAAGWQVVQPLPRVETAGRAEALAARFPAARGDIEMTRRCGVGLADALRGRVDPLQLLFPGGSLATAEQLYRESPLARAYTSLVGEAVAAAAASLPAGAPLRVLEVGGGTGGATSAVLPRLDGARTAYTFTDISPHFVGRARESFAAFPFVQYETLDIEADPTAQGFSAGEYDLVIAANVIHATADLRRSLGHIRRLLRPGGALILLEMVAPLRWIDISFGLTSGWWKFSDRELRADYPLLQRAGWLKLLGAVGFDAADAFPAAPHNAGLELQQIIYARSAGGRSEAGEPGLHNLLIFADAGGVGEQLAQRITAQGGHAALVYAGASFAQTAADRFALAPGAPDHFQALLRTQANGAQAGWDGVVYLWPLDSPPLADSIQPPAEAQQALLGGALHLAQALVNEGAGTRLWLVTRAAQPAGDARVEPAQATVWGFARSLVLEHPELQSLCIDLEPASSTADAATALHTELLQGAPQQGGESEIALRGGRRLAPRLVRVQLPAAQESAAPALESDASVQMVITQRGSLENLAPQPLVRRAPGAGEVEIRVAATALNFKDVLNVLGMVAGEPDAPGAECSGTVVAVGAGVSHLQVGDRVAGLARGSFGGYVTVDAAFVAPIPPGLSFAQAAALPIAYITAAFALHHVGKLRAGERLLIHAAAGGVGLAALHLAQRAGATLFATAGSDEKRAYLRSLGVEHVFDSRSLHFADAVRAATNGEGVDLVLNSLAGAFVLRSLELLRPGGRMLELGKRDAETSAQVAARSSELAARNVTDHVLDWSDDARTNPALIGNLLRTTLADVGSGALPALPLHTFAFAETAAAFRFMAQARHTGKVVVEQPVALDAAGLAMGLRSDGSYLITGGLSGLGLLTAQRLVERGARHLALLGRREPNPQTRELIASWEQAGVQVLVLRGDVALAEDVAAALARIAAELPPLRGIFHSAGALDDGALPQQSWPRFARVLAAKVEGAWQLHTQTRALELDYFVLYSSMASLMGSAGQTNHAAANAWMDALAHRRRADGLPALSIQWGAWSEVGAAVSTGAVERVDALGMGAIDPPTGLALLERLLAAARAAAAPAQVGVMPVEWPLFLARARAEKPAFLSDFATSSAPLAVQASASTSAPAPAAPAEPDIVQKLAQAAPARRLPLLREFVRESTGRVLGLPAARIDDDRPLNALGLDSLMAVELRNLLGAGLALPRRLPATLVFDYPNVAALTTYLAGEALPPEPAPAPVAAAAPAAEAAPTAAAPAGDGSVASMLDSLEDLSDEEIDRLLAAKRQGTK